MSMKENIYGRVAGAAIVTASMLGALAACGNDEARVSGTQSNTMEVTDGDLFNSGDVVSTDDTVSEEEGLNQEAGSKIEITTTTGIDQSYLEAVKELFDTSEADLTFECVSEGAETGVIDVKALDGKGAENLFVIPKQNYLLPTDETKTDDDHKKWSDAMAPPVLADKNDKEAVLKYVKANGCEDVLTLFTQMNFIAEIPLRDGLRVSDVNPLFAKFEGDAGKINDLATDYINSIARMETEEDLAAYYEVIADAQALATVMNNFDNAGVQHVDPIAYSHLKNFGVDGSLTSAPEVERVEGTYTDNPATATIENEFIVLRGTSKSGVCVAEWGINLGDHRPALLPSEGCEEPEVPTTSSTTPTGSTPNSEVTTTTSGSTTTTGLETTTTVAETTTTGATTTTVAETTTTRATTTTLADKNPQTPTGATAVPTTIEAPIPGSSTPTTSMAPTTTARPGTTTTTIYEGPANSAPQSSVVVTAPTGF